ncbi:MAG: hypothetical protein JWN67_610 [Actinomycetia bacterium]|nr:hypothetical protein [Actinomycetes bacterium]
MDERVPAPGRRSRHAVPVTSRADTAAAGLAELLVGDAVDAAGHLGKHIGLKPRSPQLPLAYPELLAMRVACAELVFEEEGAQFQRLAAPALLRRELASELAKPARFGTARRRLVGPLTSERLVTLVDQRKDTFARLATAEAVVDHHCRRLMEVTGKPMAAAAAGWMAFRLAEVHAVNMARSTATNLVEDGWFDAA